MLFKLWWFRFFAHHYRQFLNFSKPLILKKIIYGMQGRDGIPRLYSLHPAIYSHRLAAKHFLSCTHLSSSKMSCNFLLKYNIKWWLHCKIQQWKLDLLKMPINLCVNDITFHLIIYFQKYILLKFHII